MLCRGRQHPWSVHGLWRQVVWVWKRCLISLSEATMSVCVCCLSVCSNQPKHLFYFCKLRSFSLWQRSEPSHLCTSLWLYLCVLLWQTGLAHHHEARFFLKHTHTKTAWQSGLPCCFCFVFIDFYCLELMQKEILQWYCARVCMFVHRQAPGAFKSKYWLYCFQDLLISASAPLFFLIILWLHIDLLSLFVSVHC